MTDKWVRLADVDFILEKHYSRMAEGHCSRRWVLGKIASLAVPLPSADTPALAMLREVRKRFHHAWDGEEDADTAAEFSSILADLDAYLVGEKGEPKL